MSSITHNSSYYTLSSLKVNKTKYVTYRDTSGNKKSEFSAKIVG